MKALFISPEQQRKFEDDGFVKVQLLNPAEVAELLGMYKTVAAEHEKINIPYITTSLTYNAELIANVDTALQKIIGPAIARYLINYKLLFGNFLIKMPVDQSETEPHQDITFVDEEQYASVNIWVALQDTDTTNGCMYFLKGSHKFIPTLRPGCIYNWEYENVKAEIIEKAEIFPAKAGEAFIFNHAVVHGSYPNTSGQPRVAGVIAAYHDDAPLIHYYMPDPKKNVLQKYNMTKEAFLTFAEDQPPAKGVFVNEITHNFRQLNKKEFNALVKNKSGNYSWWQSINNFIKSVS